MDKFITAYDSLLCRFQLNIWPASCFCCLPSLWTDGFRVPFPLLSLWSSPQPVKDSDSSMQVAETRKMCFHLARVGWHSREMWLWGSPPQGCPHSLKAWTAQKPTPCYRLFVKGAKRYREERREGEQRITMWCVHALTPHDKSHHSVLQAHS